ncbi:unnamed protein product, partial [Cyprideis torosa]
MSSGVEVRDSDPIVSEGDGVEGDPGELQGGAGDAEFPLEEEDSVVEEMLKEASKDWTPEESNQQREEALGFKQEGNVHFKTAGSLPPQSVDDSSALIQAFVAYNKAIGACPLEFPADRAVLF